MVDFSEWKKIDLHIHSIMSNKVKDNDYDGVEYTAEELLDTLTKKEHGINIFSITDHNCVNVNLYKNIEELVKNEKYNEKINYVIGVELDINDSNIYDSVFHCLCFFESKEINIIDKAVSELFGEIDLNKRNTKDVYPNIEKVFSTFAKNNIHNILLIPHFNNKSKGIPQDIAVENLNYLCFNAYEDSNNVKNIQKSLDIYLKNGFDNFPFAVFTDNHNLKKYPEDKDGNLNEISCYILGNVNHPFNSVKTAFQEARMRVSLSNISGMRKISYPNKYLDILKIDGKDYKLSPYQNTIVGKFGSGKSLLLEKIKHGTRSLLMNEKYSEFYDEGENFKLSIDNQQLNSLDETKSIINNYLIYEFIQQENYYYKNSFTLSEAKQLFNQLNISHDFNDNVEFGFNVDNLKSSFNELKNQIINVNGKNNLNYERAFDKRDYYSFPITFTAINLDEVLETINDASETIKELSNLKINEINVFNDNELDKINEIDDIINIKSCVLNLLIDLDFENRIQNILKEYNREYINNNAKEVKDNLISDLKLFNESIVSFSKESSIFENIFNKEKFDECSKPQESNIIDNYRIKWRYKFEKEYKDVINSVIKEGNRLDNFFKSVLSTLISKEKKFSNNKEFDILIEKYIEFANSFFILENIEYDILKGEDSLLKKSAGEKSSLFIEFIFDLLEKNLQDDYNILLILDQPEDNIDNDNVFKEISDRLRKLKLKYEKFQSIIVTHNANVAITADSENIIVASEKLESNGNKKFNYQFGCIENAKFIDNVCNILEGGRKAMEKRTMKYGINIIRKVEENEI